jgi:transposase
VIDRDVNAAVNLARYTRAKDLDRITASPPRVAA